MVTLTITAKEWLTYQQLWLAVRKHQPAKIIKQKQLALLKAIQTAHAGPR